MIYGSKFEILFKYILTVEGGFSNHKYDKGGKTKYGIIKSVASKHNFNVETLTIEQAKHIYYTDYYKKFNIDKISNIKIALSIFDWSVNSGFWGTRKAQNTLVDLGYSLKVDGIIGANSLKALEEVKEEKFLKLYHEKQRAFYRAIAKNNITQEVFLKGWLNRVDRKEKFLNNLK